MTLRAEIQPYTDGDGLISCQLSNGIWRTSDNGPLFTSEYFILLKENHEFLFTDIHDYTSLIDSCMTRPGCLSRAPDDQGQEAPDDYIGVLGCCHFLGITSIPRSIFIYGLKHLGNFNNKSAWTFTGESFLWRMPQLIFLSYLGTGFWFLYPLMIPLAFYTALVIASSCMNTPISDSNARHLAWFLVIGTQKSFLCRLASKIWWKRLRKHYGDEGLRAVDKIYFKDHPFIRYQINKWEMGGYL
jgi:hypothetical protein